MNADSSIEAVRHRSTLASAITVTVNCVVVLASALRLVLG